MKNFSEKLALKITKAVGSMGAALVFTCIALISLPSAIASGNILIIVGWVAQTFLQLVLLSIIMVGQGLQSEKSAKRTDKLLGHISQDNDRILELLDKKLEKHHKENLVHLQRVHDKLGNK